MELLSFALLAIFIGMRHGMDSDHAAAIADMVGSENGKKRQVSLHHSWFRNRDLQCGLGVSMMEIMKGGL